MTVKFFPLLFFAVGLFSITSIPATCAAATPAAQSDEIVALEKKLVAARDEVAALKTALAISKSETAAAENRATALARTDSQLDSLRGQVRVLERDLQSATNALKSVAAEKARLEAALAANQDLAESTPGSASTRPSAERASARDSSTVDPRITELQTELADARAQVIAAVKGIETRNSELADLRAKLASAESRQSVSTSVTQELAELRDQVAAGRELEARVSQLEAENAGLVSRLAEAGGTKEELSRITAARDDAERKLATLNDAMEAVTRERDALRVQASKAGELEARVRQLEGEPASTPADASGGAVSKQEFDRVVAAKAEAELKLSTALRSFTLLTKERDELRARLAQLTPQTSASQEKR